MKSEYILVVSSWGYYYQLCEIVEFLCASNYSVKIVTYNLSNRNLQELLSIVNHNINIFNIPQNRFVDLFPVYRNYLIRENISSKPINSNQKILIFFEKPSLVFFNSFNFLQPIKRCYWSLELYLDTTLGVFEHIPNLKNHRKLEKLYLDKMDLLIIQDRFRADAFCGSNVLNRFYWPVTIAEKRVVKQTTNFISTLVYIGVIRPERKLDSLINWATQYDYSLTLNGVISQSYKSKIIDINPKIRFSFFESFENIEIHGKIGVVWYDETDINDRLTGSSSEKIANYLYHGIPIITNINDESYYHLFESKAGFYVNGNNFKMIIDEILVNYDYYKNLAKLQFDITYKSEFYYQKFISIV